MIRSIRGKVIEKVRNEIIVEVGNIGYNLFVTAPTLTSVSIGDERLFYVAEAIREDAHDLFGFLAPEEREAFELLRKVSGVGPKVALSIIGFYASSELHALIAAGDDTKLSLVPGIGKKLAGKIILELKGKHPAASLSTATDPDTIDALSSLGYSPAEIAQLIAQIPSSLTTTNERVTWVLRHLGQ